MAAFKPYEQWLWRNRYCSILLERRAVWVFLLLLVLIGIGVLVALSVGSASLTPWTALQTLLGEGSRMQQTLIFKLRLPRIVAVLAAGAGMGMAGCLIQTLVRNRLATPDMVGVNEGAVFAMLIAGLLSSQFVPVWWVAPLGAVAAVLLLYWLCRHPAQHAYMFVVVGIGLAAFLNAITDFLMSTESLVHIFSIYLWSMGSFVGQGYTSSMPVLLLLLLFIPLMVYLGRQLQIMRLGPVVAASLGVNVKRMQLLVLLSAVLLTAFASAIGGPVAFIALAAPVLASSFVRYRVVPLWSAALTGALLLLLSDLLVRLMAQPTEIATGIFTRIVGGMFLLWIVIRDGIRQRSE